MRRFFLLLVLFLFCGCRSTQVLAIDSVEKWRTYELTFTTTTVETTPYDEYLLKLRLTRPGGGGTVDVEGFYDDVDGASPYTWRVRICPDTLGTWLWTTIATGEGSTPTWAEATSGSFVVVDASPIDPGPIEASGKYFQWKQTGEPVFLFTNFLDAGAAADAQFPHQYMTENVNLTDAERTTMRSRQNATWKSNSVDMYYANDGDYDYNTTPWTASPFSSMVLTRWALYDQYIKAWKANGQTVRMWFFADESNFDDTVYDAPRQRLVRYAMARHSAYAHVSFVMALETGETTSGGIVEQVTYAQAAAHGAYAETKNPWGRLLTSHQIQACDAVDACTEDVTPPIARIGYTAIFTGETWMDFWNSQIGNTTSAANVYNGSIAFWTNYPTKPHLSMEFGLYGTGSAAGMEKAWAAFLGGAAGIGTGSEMESLSEFITASRVPFHRMTPGSSIITSGTGYALSEAGEHYAVYKSSTGSASITLNIAAGAYNVWWWNPASASSSLVAGSPTTSDGGPDTYTIPGGHACGTGQCVLWITNTTPDVDHALLASPVRLYPSTATDTAIGTGTGGAVYYVNAAGNDSCNGLDPRLGGTNPCAKKTIKSAETAAACGAIISVAAGEYFETTQIVIDDDCGPTNPKRIVGAGNGPTGTVVYHAMVGPLSCTAEPGMPNYYRCPRPASGITDITIAAQNTCFLQKLPPGAHIDIEPKSPLEQSLYDGWCLTPASATGPIKTSVNRCTVNDAACTTNVAGFCSTSPFQACTRNYTSGTCAVGEVCCPTSGQTCSNCTVGQACNLNRDDIQHSDVGPGWWLVSGSDYLIRPFNDTVTGTQFYAPTATDPSSLFNFIGSQHCSVEQMRIFGAGVHAINGGGVGTKFTTVSDLDVIGGGVNFFISSDADSQYFFEPTDYIVRNSNFRNMNRRDPGENRGMLNDPIANNSDWATPTNCHWGGTDGLIDNVDCYSGQNTMGLSGRRTTLRNSIIRGGHNHNVGIGNMMDCVVEGNLFYAGQEGMFFSSYVADTIFRHNTIPESIVAGGSFNFSNIYQGRGGWHNVQWRNNIINRILYNAAYQHCQPGYACGGACDANCTLSGSCDKPCLDPANGYPICNNSPCTATSGCTSGTCTWTDPRAPDYITPTVHRNNDESHTLFTRDDSGSNRPFVSFTRHNIGFEGTAGMTAYRAWAGDPCNNCENGTNSLWVDSNFGHCTVDTAVLCTQDSDCAGESPAGQTCTARRFINPSGSNLHGNLANYRLQPESAARNMGATAEACSTCQAPGTDRYGNVRTVSASDPPDVGAYAYTVATCDLDNTQDAGEECDGTDLDGFDDDGVNETCADVMGTGWTGTPSCGPTCTFNIPGTCIAPGDTTDPGVIDLVASNPGTTTCQLGWVMSYDDGTTPGNSPASNTIRRSSAAITSDALFDLASPITGVSGGVSCVAYPVPPVGGASQCTIVTGLPTGVTTHFAARVCDERGAPDGCSLSTNEPCLTTAIDTTDPAAITTLAVGTPTPISCPVTWTNAEGGGTTVLKYRIASMGDGNMNTVAEFLAATSYPTAAPSPAGADNVSISGLGPGNVYEIRIVLRDAAGNPTNALMGPEDLSNRVTCTTPAIPAITTPQNLKSAGVEGGKIE